MWECKEPRTVITTLTKNKVGGFIQPNTSTYYKAKKSRYCGINTKISKKINETE